MTHSDELLQSIRSDRIPTKEQILHARRLAVEFTDAIPGLEERAAAHRKLNDAYLNFQLAVLTDDVTLLEKCRSDFEKIVRQIGDVAGDDQMRSAR